jgi:hypothetical protein
VLAYRWNGAGGWVIVSQSRHENLSRTLRIVDRSFCDLVVENGETGLQARRGESFELLLIRAVDIRQSVQLFGRVCLERECSQTAK